MATMNQAPRPTLVKTNIAPWLSVRDADKAVEYYKAAFGAVEQYRLQDDAGRGCCGATAKS